MCYDLSQLGCNFLCWAGIMTCLNIKSPFCSSIGITLELYLLPSFFLVAHSRMSATSLILLIIFITHLIPDSFTFGLKWECRYNDVLISMGSITYALYTMVKGVSLVVEYGWYDTTIIFHGATQPTTLWHHLVFSWSILRSPCLLTELNFICTSISWQKSVTTILANWIPFFDMMMPSS